MSLREDEEREPTSSEGKRGARTGYIQGEEGPCCVDETCGKCDDQGNRFKGEHQEHGTTRSWWHKSATKSEEDEKHNEEEGQQRVIMSGSGQNEEEDEEEEDQKNQTQAGDDQDEDERIQVAPNMVAGGSNP